MQCPRLIDHRGPCRSGPVSFDKGVKGERTFGWKTEQLGPDMGNYVLVTTTESDENRRPKEPGMINGGFYPKRDDWPAQYPSVVIAVDDISASAKKVVAAGGTVLGEPMEIPGYGLYVSFLDTEGNRVSMMQPDEKWKKKKKTK